CHLQAYPCHRAHDNWRKASKHLGLPATGHRCRSESLFLMDWFRASKSVAPGWHAPKRRPERWTFPKLRKPAVTTMRRGKAQLQTPAGSEGNYSLECNFERDSQCGRLVL